MRTIKRWEGLRSFAGMLVAYTSDEISNSEVKYGILAKTPSSVTGGGLTGFPLSRFVDVDEMDQVFHLTSQRLGAENFRFRAVGFAELRTIILMVENDEARFEHRSKGSSLAFLQRFGQLIGIDLEDGDST